jgi:hypothetical protein
MLMLRNNPSPLRRILTLIDLGSLLLIFVLAPIVHPTLLGWKPTNIEYSKDSLSLRGGVFVDFKHPWLVLWV